MPRSAMARPISGASVDPARGERPVLVWQRRVVPARFGVAKQAEGEHGGLSLRSLAALGARGEAHRLVGCLEQGARLAHAFGLLALGH